MSPRLPGRLGRGGDTPLLLRVYLLAGAVLLAVSLLIYFHSVARRVERQTEAMSGLVASSLALSVLAMQDSPDGQGASSSAQDQFLAVIHALSFPVLITDVNGFPLTWNRRLGVDPMPISQLEHEDLADPSPELARVLAARERMDGKHPPAAMFEPGAEAPIAFLHYGSPDLIDELRLIPWITIGIAAVFGLVALLMIRGIKRAEQSFIWAGMAKETAHQMGTPLSSLIGWMEVLKDEMGVRDSEIVLPRELFEEVVEEVGRDTERLNRVAARFSQIGSAPRLTEESAVPVVEATVDYFRRRFPEGVSLELEVLPGSPSVRINPELLGWVLENLLKNAMNAVQPGPGRVSVRVGPSPAEAGLTIVVRDDGGGVPSGMEKQIFRPGVSTRQRGWGLGLPLSQRIVESYHGGSLELTWSEPGRGAEFTVSLPPA